jgi:hypothetical protein
MQKLLIVPILMLFAAPPPGQEKHPFNERPADVRIQIANSRKKYDGGFVLTGTARVCGELPATLNFSGVPAFVVQFYPDPATGKEPVMDVTFDSKELVGKVTTTTNFQLNVTVQGPSIGSPPAYVLDTVGPRKGKGTATLTMPTPGTTVLKVLGANDMGESIDFTLTCGPRK